MKLKIVIGLYMVCLLFLGLISAFQVQGEISHLYSSSGVSLATPSEKFESQGKVTRIIDGDTLEVDGIRVRLVGVDTPERGEAGYNEAAEFVKSLCPAGSIAGLDIDDKEPKDKYGRTLAVVYCGGVHVNKELLRRGYAEVMFIPPSEFDPYSW